MGSGLILAQGPAHAELAAKRAELAAVRGVLAEREADVAQVRAQLKVFEGRYLRQVGVLYAEIDELDARIAEREVDLYDSDAARRRAAEARERARETHDAAFGEAQEAEEFEPPPSLKVLFREVAKRIHPDFARDETERAHLTLLMARANLAYSRGDADLLQGMLDDHFEVQAATAVESEAAEMGRIARQMQHATRDIAKLEAERATLLGSELGLLQADAARAAREHRDLLTELAASLQEQITALQYRFDFVNRQIAAQVR